MIKIESDRDIWPGREQRGQDIERNHAFCSVLLAMAGHNLRQPLQVILRNHDRVVLRRSFSRFSSNSVIPRLCGQNPCAQSRNPMDMIFQGMSISVFHA